MVTEALAKHYETLGLSMGATEEQIKTAYRYLAMVWHPDRFGDGNVRLKDKATEQFKAIQNAYDRLRPPTPKDTDELLPLQDEVVATTAAILKLAGRVVEIQRLLDNRSAAKQLLNDQQDLINRLQNLITRFEVEEPSQSRSVLESALDTLQRQRVQLMEAAVNAGFIQSR